MIPGSCCYELLHPSATSLGQDVSSVYPSASDDFYKIVNV